MKGSTHLAAGMAAALLLADKGVVPAVALVAGSILPDIDSPKSIVGRHVPVLPRILPHRTITHSLLFCAAAFAIHPYLALGILIHIGLDMLNPKGVHFFWPASKLVRAPYISRHLPQDGWFDHFLGGTFFLLASFLAVCLMLDVAPASVFAGIAS